MYTNRPYIDNRKSLPWFT